MDKETIQRLDNLRMKLADVQRDIVWMDGWGRNLYPGNPEDRFFVTIQRHDNSKCVFQGEMPFADVDRLFQKKLSAFVAEKDDIERQIDDL